MYAWWTKLSYLPSIHKSRLPPGKNLGRPEHRDGDDCEVDEDEGSKEGKAQLNTHSLFNHPISTQAALEAPAPAVPFDDGKRPNTLEDRWNAELSVDVSNGDACFFV
jgi:hypothetical protein